MYIRNWKKKKNYAGTVRKRGKKIMYKKKMMTGRGSENFGYTDNPVRIRAAIMILITIIIIICTI